MRSYRKRLKNIKENKDLDEWSFNYLACKYTPDLVKNLKLPEGNREDTFDEKFRDITEKKEILKSEYKNIFKEQNINNGFIIKNEEIKS